MKTSYFAKLSEVVNPISISSYDPAFSNKIPGFRTIAPSFALRYDLRTGRISPEQFLQQYYLETLAVRDPHQVHALLSDVYGTEDYTLLCYEKPSDCCHRHVVAAWFRRAGIPAIEHGDPDNLYQFELPEGV